VPTYQAFAATDLLGELALERMLAKLSTRRYPAGLEPVGGQVERTATGTSRSAVSRRFVARTEHALAELLAQDLSELDLVALLVDGIRVADHTCVVALGITIDGTKLRVPWPRVPPRTSPSSATCWSDCTSVAWRSPGRC
jgi:putative transposase